MKMVLANMLNHIIIATETGTFNHTKSLRKWLSFITTLTLQEVNGYNHKSSLETIKIMLEDVFIQINSSD